MYMDNMQVYIFNMRSYVCIPLSIECLYSVKTVFFPVF